ncbi:MAG: hypothetical protein HOV67_23360 [Kribbellaceae bacterium]|nr:hypothetical protein [Kribbellaceae bacterium]
MNRRQQAHEILRDLDLQERWSPHGEMVIVGSVATDLVVAPDIDLEIHSPDPRPADGFAVLAPLAEHPNVRRIAYLDARDRHEQGQYWKLEYETPDVTWTVDMWIFGPGVPGAALLTAALQTALTPRTRSTILAIKEQAAALGERAPGYWLYQAVLDHGVRTYADFQTWLGARNIYARTGWLPSSSSSPQRE